MIESDSEVLWTYERLMKKTGEYCKFATYELDDVDTGTSYLYTGWWLTKQATDDALERLECLN